MDFQSVGFLSREKELTSPHPTLVDEAFRTLSPQGTLTITCRPTEIAALLMAAERAGFRSMRVDRTEGLKILAHKSGPQGAGYRGPAAAAMDDEGRLMLNAVEPPKSGTDPFLEDAKRLIPWLGLPAGTKDRIVVFYPGPFKLLILKDGSIVRRGQPIRLPAEQANELEQQEGAWLNPKVWSVATDPRNYAALYRDRGAVCLLESLDAPDLDALDSLPVAMRKRLAAVIERGEDYFLLTGSDPAQKDGCCPSNEVGQANALVQAGILSATDSGTNPDCPVTIYAFAAEIRRLTAKPLFIRNQGLRSAVKERLEKGPRLSGKLIFRFGLVLLLGAALAVLAFALFRQFRGH